jgi:hypothetical protein
LDEKKGFFSLSFEYFSGLGIDRILLNYLNVYNDPGNLVLVLNTTSAEEVRTFNSV